MVHRGNSSRATFIVHEMCGLSVVLTRTKLTFAQWVPAIIKNMTRLLGFNLRPCCFYSRSVCFLMLYLVVKRS